MYIKWWPPPRKSPPDYEVEHHVIKIWTKCQKCLKITPNLHNAWTALFVNPLVEKGDEWNFWSRKKLHLERPPTHPFLLLLCCRVKPCTTPLLFHIVSSQCFHIDTRYGQWEKYTSANCKWRTLFFYFTEIVKNFAHWAMYCCTFVPLLLPPLWHLTLKGAVLHWRKQKLLCSATHAGTKFCPTAIVNTGAGGILLWRFSALSSRELGHEIDRDFSIGWFQLMVILKHYDLSLWLSISWLLAKFFNLNILDSTLQGPNLFHAKLNFQSSHYITIQNQKLHNKQNGLLSPKAKSNFDKNTFKLVFGRIILLTFLSTGPDQVQSRFASMPAGLWLISQLIFGFQRKKT